MHLKRMILNFQNYSTKERFFSRRKHFYYLICFLASVTLFSLISMLMQSHDLLNNNALEPDSPPLDPPPHDPPVADNNTEGNYFWIPTNQWVFNKIKWFLFYSAPAPGWDIKRSRSLPLYIFPDVKTTIIEPSLVCKTADPILILIVVCSGANSFERRY